MPEMTPQAGPVTVQFDLINEGSTKVGFKKEEYYCQTGVWTRTSLDTRVKTALIEGENHKFKRIRMKFIPSPSWIALREVKVESALEFAPKS